MFDTAKTAIPAQGGFLKNVCHDFIYLLGSLCNFQHCTGHITMGSFVGRGNQYIQLVKVLYCNLPTNGKQLPAFPHKVRGKTCHEISHAELKCTHPRGRGNGYTESALATYEVHLWGNRDQVMKLNSHAC